MKIVQLFNREKVEYNNFKEINNKHKKAHIRTILYYSIFFPVAEILSSIAVGLLIWFAGLQVVNKVIPTVGDAFAFIMWAHMLYRPLRQIAAKYNQLQMGIVAGGPNFYTFDTVSRIEAFGAKTFRNVKGTIWFT